jgi:hypothetical protein
VAQLEQERHVELVSGASQSFVITSRLISATIPDELPHINVFVLAVTDVTDPKSDTLARVAMLADLTTLPIGRTAGIAAPGPNGIEFLTPIVTNSYSTLETANDAATAVQDRVGALINDWETFRTQFNAPDPTPAIITVPKVDVSQKQALIDAYAIAKQARYGAQIDKADADDALTRAQADFTYKSGLLTTVAAMLAEANVTQTNFTNVVSQFGALLTAGQAFYSLNSGGPGAGTFLAALNVALSQQGAMPGFLTVAAQLATDVLNYQTARTADANAASAALTAAQADQIAKTQTLASAQATETAALAAVLAVCPDFDKHSIPFVPDNEP